MRIGTVVELWRYPVKSMQGEALPRAVVRSDGLSGDRGYALRDETAGEIRGAKNIPAVLQLRAAYLHEPNGDVPPVMITFPDATSVRSDAADVHARLSGFLDRAVTLWPRQPADNTEHYRRVPPEGGDPMVELRRMFGLDADDPLPPLQELPPELFEYVAPLGTYFDAFPLHLLSTATLAGLRQHHPSGQFDARRFRPNVLIAPDDGTAPFPEEQWRGRRVRLGSVEAEITMPAMRCVMTMTAQPDLPKDPLILRTIVKRNRSNAGVYATIAHGGTVQVGDVVELI